MRSETARRLRAGTAWVNGYEETDDMNFPFGGFEESGTGCDYSLHALEVDQAHSLAAAVIGCAIGRIVRSGELARST